MPDETVMGHCAAVRCRRDADHVCAYVDRHDVACSTQWCDLHVAMHGGVAYCRRHADTLAGLTTPFDGPPPLPAVGNRSASLLNWMADLLDDPVYELLNNRRRPLTEDLISDYAGAAAPVEDPDATTRDWIRRWKIVDHESGEAVATVAVVVREDADNEVVIAVNEAEIHRGSPPWIPQSTHAGRADPATDSRERRAYLDAIVAEVGSALEDVRPTPRGDRFP